MAFPTDVITRTITSGFPFGLVDDTTDLVIELTLTPSRSMVWASNGSVGVGRPITKTSAPSQQLSMSVAVTDQAGWLDGAGNALSVAGGAHTHTYTAKVYIKTSDGRVIPGGEFAAKTIVVPTGDLSPIDLDLLLPTSTVGSVPVAIPDIWSQQLTAAQAAAAEAAAALEEALPAPSGTKSTGYAPVVQADGSVAWAAVSSSGSTTGVAQDTDGVYYPSSTGSTAIVADTDGVYYPA